MKKINNTKLKHDWEPTDSNGWEMVCMRCGLEAFFLSDDYNDILASPCPDYLPEKAGNSKGGQIG